MLYFLLLVLLVVIVVIPITISYLIYKLIKKKVRNKWWRLIALTPILFVGYYIYIALNPLDSFYKEEFETVTGMSFPDNGKILYKTATYPDFGGDYTSKAIIKLDEVSINNIKNQLTRNQFEEIIFSPAEKYNAINKFKGKKMIAKYSKDDYVLTQHSTVTFFEDGETIEVVLVKW